MMCAVKMVTLRKRQDTGLEVLRRSWEGPGWTELKMSTSEGEFSLELKLLFNCCNGLDLCRGQIVGMLDSGC